MSEQLPFDPYDVNYAHTQRVLRWMQAGLDGYLEKDAGRWAFHPFERYIGVRDDLAEDLRAIYEDSDPDIQGLWRSAIRDLLATQGRDPSKGTATRVLIDLAVLVRAHEVLDVLPTLLAGDADSLLDQVVQTAVALASPTDAARACLESIRTSPSFSADYAGLVLLALCHVDPDGWLSHVENLAQPISILASRLEDDSTALRFYARGILDAISLSRLQSADLNRLGTDSNWLLDEWLGGSSSLLCYEADAVPGPRLWFRDNSAVSVRLNEPLTYLMTLGDPTRQSPHESQDVSEDLSELIIRTVSLKAVPKRRQRRLKRMSDSFAAYLSVLNRHWEQKVSQVTSYPTAHSNTRSHRDQGALTTAHNLTRLQTKPTLVQYIGLTGDDCIWIIFEGYADKQPSSRYDFASRTARRGRPFKTITTTDHTSAVMHLAAP